MEKWCADQNLRPAYKLSGKAKNLRNWFYLVGKGYHWRVTCDTTLQIGDTYEKFDRWALCDREEVPLPKTHEEFRQAVKQLLAAKSPTPALSPEKGYYKGCKRIDDGIDDELYLYIEKRSNSKDYLVKRR